MKKFLLAAFFCTALFGLSYTSAYAVDCAPGTFPLTTTTNGPKPGCPCDAAQLQERAQDVKRVEGASIDKQITKQNDNSIGMTCFDHALKLTSKLGLIFSDIPTTGTFPAANTRVFGTDYDDAFGTGINPNNNKVKTLANALDHVITDMMQGVALNFTDSLSNMLGATNLQFMSAFMDPINALVTAILAPLAAIQTAINAIQTIMNTLLTTLDLLNSMFPSLAPAWINTIITPIWKQIKTTLLAAVQKVQQTIITTITDALKTLMTAAESTLTGVDPTTGRNPNDPAEGECSRIQRLWNPVSVTGQALTGNFRPVEGGGTEMGTPYTSIMNILKQNVPGGGEYMLHEITNVTNNATLTSALADLQAGGALNAPGNTPSWPPIFGNLTPGTAGVFPVIGGAAMSAIRGAM